MAKALNNSEFQLVGECLYRSRNSKIYYAIIKRGGKQIKRSLRTTDGALAKRKLSELLDRASALSKCETGKIGFSELAERWLTATGASLKPASKIRQKVCINALNIFFSAFEIRRISKTVLEEWADQRGEAVAARTFNHERDTLSRILTYAVREGILLDNPALVIKKRKVRQAPPDIPTKEQFSTLIKTMREARADALPAADLCELIASSGCRLNEANSIRWGDVNFDQKRFVITGGETGTKNHEFRVVPLFPALENFLQRKLTELPQPPESFENVVGIKSAKKAMIAACKKAGLPNFTHHHLRHFFCSNAIEAGIDFKAIAGWLGHRDGGLLVAKTYGHLRDEHSAIMAQRMTFGVNNV